jgi:RND family efflux transporter MFP subunit
MSHVTLERLAIDKPRSALPGGRGGWRYGRRLAAVILLLLLAGGLFSLVRGHGVTVETTTIARVFPTQFFTLLNASGYVVAQRKASVAAKTTGRLEWLGVEEGSRVTAGQMIARLENRDLDAAVRQNRAAVENARALLEQARAELADADQSFVRQKELLAQGIVSRSDYDAVEARYKKAIAGVAGAESGMRAADAALAGALVNFDYSLIRAPFDAVVLTKNADVGDLITPLGAAANAKAAVVTIADLDSVLVEADVSESNLSQVTVGQPCEIMLDALPDARFRGLVHAIVPTADRTKASVMVKVRFLDRDPRILPEMSAKVAFLQHEARQAERQPRIAVRPSAIVTVKGKEGVYLVQGDRVIFTPVRRGETLGDLVEIHGVRPGEKVALKPLDTLRDGARITLPENR